MAIASDTGSWFLAFFLLWGEVNINSHSPAASFFPSAEEIRTVRLTFLNYFKPAVF
jgi:hypothetical protein